METGEPHCRHSCSEYQLLTTAELHDIIFEESYNRKAWEVRYPALGLDTPRHFIDCVKLVACGTLEIVKGDTKSIQGDKIGKYTIVSHPWTKDLEELVEASKLVSCRNDDVSYTGGQNYFQTVSGMLNWTRGSILDALMELAQCTVSLGVRYMWVDSLCLDQCSKENLAFEIGRMYSYYKNAHCTIVCLNGLGEPTCLGEWPTAVARWFSRVWTFQEGVACHKAYCISTPVTGILSKVVAILMEDSTCDDSIHQLVIQTMDSRHVTASQSPQCRAKLYEQVCHGLPCCCCSVYYRAEDGHNIDERGKCMQQMHFRSHLYNWQQVGLMMKWAVLITCQTEEVCRRHCSVEEDRVLAVLGMLGIGAIDTLRSGLSLYDQTKWLCGVAGPEVIHALVVKNNSNKFPSMPGSSWMPDLRRNDIGWLDGIYTIQSPIGRWEYDFNTNRVIGSAQIPCCVRIVTVVGKETSEPDVQDILHEFPLLLDFGSWWTITFSFELANVDPPKNVATVEVLAVVFTNESGKIFDQIVWLNGHSRGVLDISSVVASGDISNMQDDLTNQALVGLPVMEDVRDESPDGYSVAVLLCTGPEEQLHKAGGLVIESGLAPEVAHLMWRQRQASKSLERVVQMG